MTTIGITGAYGFLGFHLRSYFLSHKDIGVKSAGREIFSDPEALTRFTGECDAIVHLAGLNRASDEELLTSNPGLAKELTDALDRSGNRPQLIFSSSTHVDRDTAYGESKRQTANHLKQWCEANQADFADLIIPNIFGEYGKPFYNSAVSTFCHQLAHGESLTVNEGEVELVHAQQVAELIHRCVDNSRSHQHRMEGVRIRVPELAAKLTVMSDHYQNELMPKLSSDFDLRLFNTFRSYLFPHFYPRALTLHTDERGSLFESVRSLNGGQCFISSTKPGITRGNHYHHHKVERFLVLRGEAVIQIRKLFSDQVHDFPVSGEKPAYIDMPPFHTHNITNTGSEELITLFWSHEIFDPEHPDTYAEPVVL